MRLVALLVVVAQLLRQGAAVHPHGSVAETHQRVEILQPYELATTIPTIGYRYYGTPSSLNNTHEAALRLPSPPPATSATTTPRIINRHRNHTPPLLPPPLPPSPPPARSLRPAVWRGAECDGLLHDGPGGVPRFAHAHGRRRLHRRLLSLRRDGRPQVAHRAAGGWDGVDECMAHGWHRRVSARPRLQL